MTADLFVNWGLFSVIVKISLIHQRSIAIYLNPNSTKHYFCKHNDDQLYNIQFSKECNPGQGEVITARSLGDFTVLKISPKRTDMRIYTSGFTGDYAFTSTTRNLPGTFEDFKCFSISYIEKHSGPLYPSSYLYLPWQRSLIFKSDALCIANSTWRISSVSFDRFFIFHIAGAIVLCVAAMLLYTFKATNPPLIDKMNLSCQIKKPEKRLCTNGLGMMSI